MSEKQNALSIPRPLSAVSDEALVRSFNDQIGNPWWSVARSVFLCAIVDEFDARGIDRSGITEAVEEGYESFETVSFSQVIRLADGKVRAVFS